MENYNVSFGARRIGTANIRAKINNKWKDIPVSFVRLHPKTNKGDKAALESVTNLWQGKNLSGSIQEQAEICNDPVFALTTQNENFKSINPKKILGMLTTNDFKSNAEDTAEIFRLGVNPEYAYTQNKNKRDLKHIGAALIKKFVDLVDKRTNVRRVVATAEEPSEVRFLQKMNMNEKNSNFKYTNFEINKENFDEFVK